MLTFNNKYNDFFQGGFDMICSGRDKIETPEQVRVMRLHIYYLSSHIYFLPEM